MKLNNTIFPKHIAIIMDGNGRWAKERGLNRTVGHEKGAKVARDITIHCNNIGIKYLTLYAFSTENWNRPKLEIEFLMRLLEKYLKNELLVYLKNNVRFKVIGDISKFSQKLQAIICNTEEKTSKNTGLTQTIALNYGSKDEIIRAIKKLNKQKLQPTQENLNNCLDTADFPDVDLLIRTGGEIRISNYLLWQSAYAEMFFTQSYWPEFCTNELDDIISDFHKRERRFGGI
jgi:undecaprenyl diphosphate synthase